jgi:hypothetical protein
MRYSNILVFKFKILFLLILGLLMFPGYNKTAQADEELGGLEQHHVVREFTNAILTGTYSVSSAFGIGGHSPLASIGVLEVDGNGNFSNLIIANVPGQISGEREFIEIFLNGTYIVNPNGTGTTTLEGEDEIFSNFVFTKVDRSRRAKKVATEIFMILKDLDASTGNLVTVVAKRIPDKGMYTERSFLGDYSVATIAQGGQSPAAAASVFTFDGEGNFFGTDIINLPGELFGKPGERVVIEVPVTATYSVNSNGTGTAQLDGVGEARFVITKAKAGRRNINIAEEAVLIVKDLNSLTENLVRVVLKKIQY